MATKHWKAYAQSIRLPHNIRKRMLKSSDGSKTLENISSGEPCRKHYYINVFGSSKPSADLQNATLLLRPYIYYNDIQDHKALRALVSGGFDVLESVDLV